MFTRVKCAAFCEKRVDELTLFQSEMSSKNNYKGRLFNYSTNNNILYNPRSVTVNHNFMNKACVFAHARDSTSSIPLMSRLTDPNAVEDSFRSLVSTPKTRHRLPGPLSLICPNYVTLHAFTGSG